MLGKLLLLAAVIVLVIFGWKRLEGMARKASRLVRDDRDDRDPIDLERDPESGSWRRRDRDR